MENTSKALIMAGGVLLSMLIISVMIFAFRSAGRVSSEYDTDISNAEVVKFNGQFEVYARENNTYLDVITVSNLAYSVNNQNGNDISENNSVKIYIMDKFNNIKFSILPNSSLKKNYFFKGENMQEDQLYMYEQDKNNGLLKLYGLTDENNRYKYLFSCKDGSSIKYSSVGRVCEMRFKIVQNT